MNPPAPRIPGGNLSEVSPVNPTLFDPEQVALAQAEMQRLMRDYPDGNIPEATIAEWEAMAERERLGHEADDLAESIAADEAEAEADAQAALFETPQKQRARRTRATRTPKTDIPPADMEPDEQDSSAPDVIKLNRADSKLATNIARLYSVVGVVLYNFNQTDGVIIISNAEARARELVLLSNHHPAMKKALRSLTESNDYITFAFGHGGMMLAILQAHGVMPQDIGKRVFGMFRRPALQPQG